LTELHVSIVTIKNCYLFFGYFEPVDIILLTGTLFKIVLVIIIKMISSFITVADKLLQSQVQSIEPAACCHTRQH